MASDTDLAWAAGFFDGEGSLGIYRKTQYHRGRKYAGWHVHARVAGCCREAIERFAEIVGEGTVRKEPRLTAGNRNVWVWCGASATAMDSLSRLLPYLTVKREQVELGIEFRKTVANHGSRGTPSEILQRQAAMADAMKAMKRAS
jgi:hypothetical protein